MSKIAWSLGTAAAAAAGSAVALAYRISKETGRSFPDALGEVPAEAHRYWEELRARSSEAYEAGKQAAREKQTEIEEQLDEQ